MHYTKKESWWMGIIGGIFGWVAILSLLGSIIGVVFAMFFDRSWWIPVGLFLSFLFFKAVMKEYHKEWAVSGKVENVE